MSEEADILSVSQFQLAPAILQGQTKEKMLSLVSALQHLTGRLTSLRMQHLFMILASPRLAFLTLCVSILNRLSPVCFLFHDSTFLCTRLSPGIRASLWGRVDSWL